MEEITLKRRCLFVCFVFVFLIAIQLSHARTVDAAEMNFSVKAVRPKNQVNNEVGYFDLRMEPGQRQTVQVILGNSTDQEVVVAISPNTARTSSTGHVDYSTANAEYDDSLVYPFTALVSTENEVSIQPNSSYVLEVTIQMPEESFDGIILGGLYFIEKDTETVQASSSTVQVENLFSYVIGVRLTETDTAVAPEMKLHKVYASQTNYRNTVKVNLQNPTTAVIEDLKITAAVYTKDGDSVLHEMNKEGMTVAPNSNFNYGISWENQKFTPGTYRLEMIAESGEQQWAWTEYFAIEKEESQILNDEAVELEGSINIIWLWVTVSIAGVTLLTTLFIKWKKIRNA